MEEVRDIDSSEAFGNLIERVKKGEQITLTEDGRPVARLVQEPEPEAFDPEVAKAAIEAIMRIGDTQTLGGITLWELINEGRKY